MIIKRGKLDIMFLISTWAKRVGRDPGIVVDRAGLRIRHLGSAHLNASLRSIVGWRRKRRRLNFLFF